MKKYRPPLTEDEKKELIRLSKLDFSDYSEADIREEFLVELLKILGYRKELDYSISREESYNLHPLFLSVGSSRIRLDYLCSLRKKYFWLIDAKKGKCSDNNNPPQIVISEIGQAYFYTLHPEINCPYFIVSNGWYTNLYHRNDLDENGSPLLSIQSHEIYNRFLELDSFVGSTQILPFLKSEILNQVEKTLSTELRVDRLDEFVEEIEKSIAKIKPAVRENAWKAHEKEQKDNKSKINALYHEDLYNLVYDIFQAPVSRIILEKYSKIIHHRLVSDQIWGKQLLFFEKLLLREPYYVSYWYYSSVLALLLYLKKNNFEINFGSNSPSLDDILQEWIDLCLFGLEDKKHFRVLFLFEAFFYRLGKKQTLISIEGRNTINNVVAQENFYLPEESIAVYGPSEACTLINLVTQYAQHNTELILIKYKEKKSRGFKTNLAIQEYKHIINQIDIISPKIDAEYQRIKSELGSEWSELLFLDRLNTSFDSLGSATCDILNWYKEISFPFLGEEQKDRIKLMAELGCTNHADTLLDELQIEWDKDFRNRDDIITWRKKYFDPDVNQREFKLNYG